ncbi:hypothetical protein ACIBQ0_17010 [Nocardia nova]|uniref:hypothetical protein n=1 Tax=Nocardia nova TaxID=37330 RepID=UPI003797689A
MTGRWWLAADLDNIGRAEATALHCVCGDTHTIKTLGIQNPAIPTLATSIVTSLDEWREQREWCRTHRPHGGITQRHEETDD